MTTNTELTKQEMLDKIKDVVLAIYDVKGYTENSWQPDTLHFDYKTRGTGGIIAGRVGEMMVNYPDITWSVKCSSQLWTEVSIL